MKTAIYIEDGVVQLVLTPESDFEKNAIKSFADKPTETQIFSGTFYDCRGGWTRQSDHFEARYPFVDGKSDSSLIVRVTERSPEVAPILNQEILPDVR